MTRFTLAALAALSIIALSAQEEPAQHGQRFGRVTQEPPPQRTAADAEQYAEGRLKLQDAEQERAPKRLQKAQPQLLPLKQQARQAGINELVRQFRQALEKVDIEAGAPVEEAWQLHAGAPVMTKRQTISTAAFLRLWNELDTGEARRDAMLLFVHQSGLWAEIAELRGAR